jgi:hypothetical protein
MHSLRNLLLIWAFLSFALGFGVTQIPWGDPDGFHGTGFPFAQVYWDYIGDAKRPIDYPNPFALILNSAVFLVVGSIVILAIHWLKRRIRRRPTQGFKRQAEQGGDGDAEEAV